MLPGYVQCIFKSIYYTYLHQHKIYISSNAFVNFDKSLIIQQVVLFFTHYSYFLSLWPNKGNLSIIQVLRYMMKMKLFSWVTFLISSLSNCFEVLNYIQEAFQVIKGKMLQYDWTVVAFWGNIFYLYSLSTVKAKEKNLNSKINY